MPSSVPTWPAGCCRSSPSRRLDARELFPELSAREHEVLTLLAAGRSNNEIAESLVISPITARNHVSNILTKLQLTNRRDAMIRFHQRDRAQPEFARAPDPENNNIVVFGSYTACPVAKVTKLPLTPCR